MKLYKLNKKVLSFCHGAEAFLNGLTSNSMDQPRNAFLNIHGRIIATFDQVKIGDDEFLLAFEASFVDDVMQHLDRFLKLSPVEAGQKDFQVYFDLESEYAVQDGEYTIGQHKGQLVFTRQTLDAQISEEAFTFFRLKHNIPVQGQDYHNELLLNVSESEFVSFTKGCYLGQEPISKVHSRSRPSWILSVCYEDDCPEEQRAKMTSKVIDPGSGRHMGFVFMRS